MFAQGQQAQQGEQFDLIPPQDQMNVDNQDDNNEQLLLNLQSEDDYYMSNLKFTSDMVVQNPDEFLSTFSVKNGFFNNPDILAWMQTLEIPDNLIGVPSGFGSVYVTPFSPNYVLKIVNVCGQPIAPTQIMRQQLCNMATNGDVVFRIPNTAEKKTNVLAPNYLIEGVIGTLLSGLSKYTPGFMQVYGCEYDSTVPEKPLYIISERLISLEDYVVDTSSFVYTIFQVAQTLNTSQMTNKFTHLDLHPDNVMIRLLDRRVTHIYEVGDGKYLYTRFNFDTVLIDYGLSRMETEQTILSGRVTWPKQNYPSYPDIFDYSAFNPYIDLFGLLNYIRLNIDNMFPSWGNRQEKLQTLYTLLKVLLGMESSTDDILIEVITQHLSLRQDYWRGAPDKLAMAYVVGGNTVYNHCCTMQQFMVKVVETIKQTKPPVVNPTDPEYVSQYLNDNYFMISDKIVKSSTNSIVYTMPPFKMRMNTKYLNYQVSEGCNNRMFNVRSYGPAEIASRFRLRTTYTAFNQTRVPGVDASQLYVHVATIPAHTNKELGYKFKFDCCRLDIRTFMQKSSSDGAIAVNMGFFSIFDNFTPIGAYKTNSFTSYTPFPDPRYEQFLALLVIDNNGNLNLVGNISSYGLQDNAVTTGPVLIYNSQQIITDAVIAANPDLLQSGPADRISPGELRHVGNQNPRTAIAWLADGTVLIVYVEGRGDRGAGVDCSQLAQLCMSLGAIFAINLDGGRSSQLAWRQPGENMISLAKYTSGYPVGNLLSYSKSSD